MRRLAAERLEQRVLLSVAAPGLDVEQSRPLPLADPPAGSAGAAGVIGTAWLDGPGPSALKNVMGRLSQSPRDSSDAVPPATGVFRVYVAPGVRGSIQAALDQYAGDLARESYQVSVVDYSGTAEELRADLASHWSQGGLVGALLVGDLPCASFSSYDNWSDPPELVTYPHDLYFMDLDGSYVFHPGSADEHTAGTGDVGPEIYVSRITTSELAGLTGRDEATLINDYFAKAHAYRVGDLQYADRGIVFADDDWSNWGAEQMDGLYSEVLAVNGVAETNKQTYLDALSRDYQSILQCIHSGPQGHSLKVGNDWQWISNEEIVAANPRQAFHNMFNCSGALFTEPGNLIGAYVYGGDYGLNAVGSTKTGSMLDFPAYYSPQARGNNLGQAFANWFQANAHGTNEPDYDWAVDWFYGMTMQGDPTLRPTLEVAPVVQLPAGTGDNKVILRLHGDNIELRDQRTGRMLFTQAAFTSLTILGADNKRDFLTVDFGPGQIVIPDGVVFVGRDGLQNDALAILGTAQGDVFSLESGSVVANSLHVTFDGVEQLVLDGRKGNDTYQVSNLGTGTTIRDGMGIDTLDFSQAAVGASINLSMRDGQKQSVFEGIASTLALKGTSENVTGTPQADLIRGNAAANKIWGGGGDDRLYGGDGNDWLYGGPGDDRLCGATGNDRLFGESGNNVLLGGAGGDILNALDNADATGRNLLIGGLGADTLQGGPGEDILIGGTTNYDGKAAALTAVMGKWASDEALDARRAGLEAGFFDDSSGVFVQLRRKTKASPQGTVIDDGVRDRLFGGEGDDWVLNFAKEEVG